ncbi:MAG: hypothetical protein ACREOK_15640, partial [Gemmatimonadaceae bacterium]
VLVSLRADLRKFPTIRTGPEIASQRAAFLAYNVTVNADCDASAAENGYAHFALGVLYNGSKDDVPFDLNAYVTSAEPYGKWISLDGVHPSAEGHSVLARAAVVAIQQTYGTGN